MRRPTPHPSGATPPPVPKDLVPEHVAIVMDGNGRWAKQRGLPRTKGHEEGESTLFDVVDCDETVFDSGGDSMRLEKMIEPRLTFLGNHRVEASRAKPEGSPA